jgi:hypothetical protein
VDLSNDTFHSGIFQRFPNKVFHRCFPGYFANFDLSVLIYEKKCIQKEMARSASRKSSRKSSSRKSSKRAAPMKRKATACSMYKSANACKMAVGCSMKKAPGRRSKICVRSKGVAKAMGN